MKSGKYWYLSVACKTSNEKKMKFWINLKKKFAPDKLSDSINCLQQGGTLQDKNKNDQPTSWTISLTISRKNQLKRLTNNCQGVTQRRIGRKLGVSRMIISRQMNIYCFKREKRFWTMKNILLMMAPASKETIATAQITN